MPRKWVKAITYPHKIEAVKVGTCRQTIRRITRAEETSGHYLYPMVGDTILFHGWSGKPYRSKWSWRKTVVINYTQVVYIHEQGIVSSYPIEGIPLDGQPGPRFVYVYRWDRLNRLATLDGIVPPNGTALKCVLKMMGAKMLGEPYVILRW